MPHLKPMKYFHLLDGDSRLVAIALLVLVRLFAKTLRHHGEMNLVLKARVLAARDQFGVVGENPDQRLDPAALAFGEIAQHVMLHHVLVAGMTDADAYAAIVVADVLGDRAQPVMTGNAAADFDPDLGGPQVDLVMKHRDLIQRQLVEVRRLGDGASRLVHESPGQQQERALTADRSFAGDALKTPAPRPDAVALGDFRNRHETDVVAVTGVFRSRISESDQEQHRRGPAAANLTSSRARRQPVPRRGQRPAPRLGQRPEPRLRPAYRPLRRRQPRPLRRRQPRPEPSFLPHSLTAAPP